MAFSSVFVFAPLSLIPNALAIAALMVAAAYLPISLATLNSCVVLKTAVITALTALGVLVDPTSKGISDCPHCRELEHPEK